MRKFKFGIWKAWHMGMILEIFYEHRTNSLCTGSQKRMLKHNDKRTEFLNISQSIFFKWMIQYSLFYKPFIIDKIVSIHNVKRNISLSDVTLKICMRPGLACRQQLRSDFPTGRAVSVDEKWYFQRTEPDRKKRNAFSNGRAGQKKGKRIIFRVKPGR